METNKFFKIFIQKNKRLPRKLKKDFKKTRKSIEDLKYGSIPCVVITSERISVKSLIEKYLKKQKHFDQ